jgi:aminomethyltransferase
MTARETIRHTIFHGRMTERVGGDAWLVRGGFTVPARYTDVQQEALAAQTGAVLVDLSAVERLRIHGKGAVRMLSAAFGTDAGAIPAGEARDVVWRAAAGGVRGMGALQRAGETNYSLISFRSDIAWFQRAAPRFDATVRDETGERGVLLLAGPYAFGVLAAAGLEGAARLSRGQHATFDQAGIPLTIGRWDPLNGFAISVAAVHAARVFDLVWRAGEMFGLALAGQETLELLLLEAGMPLPGIDFVPARDEAATEPTLESLTPYAASAAPATESGTETAASPPAPVAQADGRVVLVGIEMESEAPAPFAPIFIGGAVVGHTLRAAYSPVLRRAIALAQLPARHAAPQTAAVVRTLTTTGTVDVNARVTALPFFG